MSLLSLAGYGEIIFLDYAFRGETPLESDAPIEATPEEMAEWFAS